MPDPDRIRYPHERAAAEIRLLPCPFCGHGKPEALGGGEGVSIRCSECRCRSAFIELPWKTPPEITALDEDAWFEELWMLLTRQAAATWNRRA